MKIKFGVMSLAVIALMTSSCSSPKDVAYFQDLQQGSYTMPLVDGSLKIRPGDKLSVTVSSKDPVLAQLFNLSVATNGTAGSGTTPLYTVDAMGNIEIPVLGPVHVGGLTRAGIASEIKQELVNKNLIKDPTVTVELKNGTVSVLGEVNGPGKYELDRDQVTLPEAIAMAGDLSIMGERQNVTLIRETPSGQREVYKVDLTSSESLFNSPAYYVQQNDVIYVEPNNTRKRQRSANGNNFMTPAFWMSVASFAASMAIIVIK